METGTCLGGDDGGMDGDMVDGGEVADCRKIL
jgi:hypothetical protein